jgi:signal recognition particle subunit SRP54
VQCLILPDEPQAVKIAAQAIDRARYMLCDTLIVDTAGRMTIDSEMMDELKAVAKVVKPIEKLLIVDAMIGQEAVNVALSFDRDIGLDGFIMTKLDGDARGGAALSIRRMTGKPIKLMCVGEKIEDIEEFYPDRLASRILGMGDVLSLIEKATATIDEKKALESLEKMRKNQFTLEDMLDQFAQVKKMGSIKDVMDKLPGMGNRKLDASQIDERAIDRNVAIIQSMTLKERRNHNLLNASRRKRIAAGSGTTVQDVNRLIKQFEETQKMMKQFSGMSRKMGKGLGFGRGSFPF